MAGGCDGHTYMVTAEALSLQTMNFAAGPTMLAERAGYATLAIPQDHSTRRALVVGGEDAISYLATTEVLTAADWEKNETVARAQHSGDPGARARIMELVMLVLQPLMILQTAS